MIRETYDELLLNMDEGGERELFSPPKPSYAPSTVKQDSKMYEFLMTFCARFNASEWRLKEEEAVALIKSLFLHGWGRATVEKCFVSGYKRLCLRYSGSPVAKNISDTMLRVCKTRKYSGAVIPANPFTLNDARRIIGLSWERHDVNPRLISLSLLCMFGGIRLTSASQATLSDILSFERLGDGGEWLLSLQLVGKGGKTHINSYRGFPIADQTQVVSDDPVFWFRRYLKEAFDLELADHKSWRLDAEHSGWRIFGWRPDAMRLNLQKWTVKFGYPPKFFNFHSLRRGSLVNRLLHGDGEIGSGVIHQSIISNWDLTSRARAQYLGATFKRVLVANDYNGGPIAKELLTPALFHGLPGLSDSPESGVQGKMIDETDRIHESSIDAVGVLRRMQEALRKMRKAIERSGAGDS